ncbi:hypothetical protein ABIA33_003723 [Streptacidiphilus sp. MAP12-16]|uniref:hypothetical protein n=1 Tax=Streptacidiphilus sp. MAP12-16 TaxID=3156300 RepID=UPI0035190EAB
MSARARLGTVAAVALTAAITGGTVLMPTAAHAAAPATSSPLTLTVTCSPAARSPSSAPESR